MSVRRPTAYEVLEIDYANAVSREAVAKSHLAALQRERDEAKEYGTRMRREWQRECEDTDLLLQGLGLCPSEYRSEGGSLLLGRIQHVINKRKAGIVAERDEAVALLRLARNNGIDGGMARSIDAFLAKLEERE